MTQVTAQILSSVHPSIGIMQDHLRRAVMDPITLLGLMLFATAGTMLIAVNWR